MNLNRFQLAVLLAVATLATLTLAFQIEAKPVPKAAEKASVKRAVFTDKQFNDEAWALSGKNADNYVRKEKEGLRITLPAINGPGKPVGIALRHKICGDFEFEA